LLIVNKLLSPPRVCLSLSLSLVLTLSGTSQQQCQLQGALPFCV
jgi:hypothetical protein